jgi:hypothetical protein
LQAVQETAMRGVVEMVLGTVKETPQLERVTVKHLQQEKVIR